MRTGLYTEKVALSGSTDPQAFFVPPKCRIDGIIFEKRGSQSGTMHMGTSYTPPVAEHAVVSNISAAVGGGTLTLSLKSKTGTKTGTVTISGGETAFEVADAIASIAIAGWSRGTVVEDGGAYSVEFVSTEASALTGEYAFNAGGTGITTGQPTVTVAGADLIPAVEEVAAVAASATLTFTGPISDGETVSVGEDVYEFTTEPSSVVGRIPVDISTLLAPAEGSVTFGALPLDGETLTVGGTTYTFKVTAADEAGEVLIGGDGAATATNLEAAINGTDTINTANTSVLATATDTVVDFTALVDGLAGNSIPLSETFTDPLITTVAMAGGNDGTAAEVIPVLLAAEQGSGTAPVAMTSPSEGVVVVTADVAGTAAESILVATTCANGSFNTPNLEGGVDHVASSPEVPAVAEVVELPNPTEATSAGEIMLTIGSTTVEIPLTGDEDADAVKALILAEEFAGYESAEGDGVITFTATTAGAVPGATYSVSYSTGVTASVAGDGEGMGYIVSDDVMTATVLPTTHMETAMLTPAKTVFSVENKTPVLVKVDTANCLGTLYVSYEKFAR